MLECAADIWKWLDGEGAQFFVCGDARRMAKDVDAALRKIIQEQGGKSEEQTNEYVEKLKSEKRYKRDVLIEICSDRGSPLEDRNAGRDHSKSSMPLMSDSNAPTDPAVDQSSDTRRIHFPASWSSIGS